MRAAISKLLFAWLMGLLAWAFTPGIVASAPALVRALSFETRSARYDARSQASIAYDSHSEPAFNYDAPSVLPPGGEQETGGAEGTSLPICAGFLAAEGTAARATQLEFNFANDFGQNSGLVIGRGADLSAPGALGAGEYKLGWFSVQSTSGMEAEWAVNQAKLQNVMNLNLPIRDASSLLDKGGFYLNRERGMLQSAGWNYQGGFWVPPAH